MRRARMASAIGCVLTALIFTACASVQSAAKSTERSSAGASRGTPQAKQASAREKGALPAGLDPAANRDPFPSTYKPIASSTTAIVGATVLTATGQQIENGTVLMAEGKIAAVGGPDTAVPQGATIVDGKGKWVTPGIIDAH